MLARTACHSGPRRCTTATARVRLLDTQKQGIQRSSICVSPKMRCNTRVTLSDSKNETTGTVGSKSFCGEATCRASLRISLCPSPIAYIAPRTAPMLVPPTRSTSTPHSSRARNTPIWAKPRAAPPPSTSPQAAR